MKRSTKIAAGIAASLTLAFGTAVYAHQGGTGAGSHGKMGMQHEKQGAMGHGVDGQGTAMQAQMHAQMQARAREHGATGPRHQGPRRGVASGSPTPQQTPSTTEHVH